MIANIELRKFDASGQRRGRGKKEERKRGEKERERRKWER